MNYRGRTRVSSLLVALIALFILLAIIGGRHARRVYHTRAVVSVTMRDLAAQARAYSETQPDLPADMATLTRERPAAARLVKRLRETLGSRAEIAFTPIEARRADWLSIAVSRRGVVLLEVLRDGEVRMYEPRLPTRSMGCHCLAN